MLIGIPKEIKVHEYRVSIPPAGVRELVENGHKVLVQSDAAQEIGMHDNEYTQSGAEIVSTPQEIFSRADMSVKVKEPQKVEVDMIRENQIVYT